MEDWPAELAWIIPLLREDAAQRSTETAMEQGFTRRPAGPAHRVLRGEVTVSDAEWQLLLSTQSGRFRIQLGGVDRFVRLSPVSVSPGNPFVISISHTTGERGQMATGSRRINLDLLLLN